MAYRNKIYVAFDGDSDIHYYYLLKAWSKSENLNFELNDAQDIYSLRDSSSEGSIKSKLRERFRNSKVFVLLVGKSTKYLYRFVRWEIEEAIKLELPIIVINLNKKRSRDDNYCPAIIRDELAMHVSFEMNIIKHAILTWPNQHSKHLRNNEKSAFYYPQDTYRKLGL